MHQESVFYLPSWTPKNPFRYVAINSLTASLWVGPAHPVLWTVHKEKDLDSWLSGITLTSSYGVRGGPIVVSMKGKPNDTRCCPVPIPLSSILVLVASSIRTPLKKTGPFRDSKTSISSWWPDIEAPNCGKLLSPDLDEKSNSCTIYRTNTEGSAFGWIARPLT